jgi:allantoinase
VQFSLPVVWTAARSRGFELGQVVEWVCGRTASFAGLAGSKGAIAPGRDADLVLWQPEAPFTVERQRIHFKNKLTPYLGRELFGVVQTTYLRGEKVYDGGEFSAAPRGHMLRRELPLARK